MNTMDLAPPFSEQEKRFVLAEAIKTSSVPVEKLLQVFSDGSIQPEWRQMLLPHGRNLQSCMDTFEALRRSPSQPPFHTYQAPVATSKPSTKRKPAPEGLEVAASSKRRHSDMTQHILPKPSNGSPGVNPSQNTITQKKRGRPSKAIVEQRQAEAIARGEVIAPPKTATPKPDILPAGESISTPVYATIAPMVSPRPAPSSMTPVTFEQFASPEVDSTGKKKRAKAAPKAPKITTKPGESSFSILNPLPGEPEKISTVPVSSTSKETGPITETEASAKPQTAKPVQSQEPPAKTQAPSTI